MDRALISPVMESLNNYDSDPEKHLVRVSFGLD